MLLSLLPENENDNDNENERTVTFGRRDSNRLNRPREWREA